MYPVSILCHPFVQAYTFLSENHIGHTGDRIALLAHLGDVLAKQVLAHTTSEDGTKTHRY